jgi:hypothetical protein
MEKGNQLWYATAGSAGSRTPGGGSFCIADHSTDEFDEPRSNSQQNSREINPSGMQPAIEGCPDQPSHDESRGEDERQLAVARELQPESPLLIRVLIVRRSRWHQSELKRPRFYPKQPRAELCFNLIHIVIPSGASSSR